MRPDPHQPTHIFITAGDPSGDIHAARLMAEIRKRIPDVIFEGFGGPEMEFQGLRSLAHIQDLAVTGFWEVAKRYRFFRGLLTRCEEAIARTKPVLFIPVDYPGFNMRLAARVRSPTIRIVWYIAPQLWAWGEGRAKELASVVDKLLVVFPFEVEFFQKHGIRAEYVGHPLSEEIRPEQEKTRSPTQILLMPGSRKQEIHFHVPLLAEVVELMNSSQPTLNFVVAKARNVDVRSLEPLAHRGVTVIEDVEHAMLTSHAALIKAGTSTLEAALRGLPFATFYRTSALTFQVSKRLVNVTSVTMMNLLLHRSVVHEYIQGNATALNLERELVELTLDNARRNELASAMSKVQSMLAGGSASARAADIISEMVQR